MQLVYQCEGGPELSAELGPNRPRVVFGRNPDVDVRLDDRAVSRRHCEFVWADGDVTVADLGSSGGTYVNGQRAERAAIRLGDVVHIGKTEIKLGRERNADPLPSRRRSRQLEAAEATIAPDAAAGGAPPGAWAVIYEAATGGEARYFLTEGGASAVVGRLPTVEIHANNPTVGRNHCRLSVQGGVLLVEDLDSSNGTFVNGKRTMREKLSDGDVLACGLFELKVVAPKAEPAEAWDDGWDDDWIDEDDMAPPSWLVFYPDDDGRQHAVTMSLESRLLAVGRAKDCDIRSRRAGVEEDHAELIWDEGVLIVKDLQSEGGTLVNGERIEDEHVLRNRDLISFGNFHVRIVRGSTSSKPPKTRSNEAGTWQRLLQRVEPTLSITYSVGDERDPRWADSGRQELTLWGDGEARLEIINRHERTGEDLRTDMSVLDLLCDALIRAGFPDAPKLRPREDDFPIELVLYQDGSEAIVALSERALRRSAAYREASDILNTMMLAAQTR